MDAMGAVRCYDMTLNIVDARSETAATRHFTTIQWGLLPFLTSLRSITLHVWIWENFIPEEPLKPLPMLRAAIRAICNLARQACLTVVFETDLENDGHEVISVLAVLLQQLQSVPKLSLTLAKPPLAVRDILLAQNAAYPAFQSLTPALRSLTLHDACWLALCPGSDPLPCLASLTIHVDVDDLGPGDQTPLPAKLCSLVGACGSNLKDLSILVDNWEEDRPSNTVSTYVPDSASLVRCTPLRQLSLAGRALGCLNFAIEGWPARSVKVRIASEKDWEQLRSYLERWAQGSPTVEQLHLDVHMSGDSTWPTGRPLCDTVLGLARASKCKFTSSFRAVLDEAGRSRHMLEFIRCLADSVQELDICLDDTPFDPVEIYQACSSIALPRCSSIKINLLESQNDLDAGSSSDCLAALLRLIEGPVLEMMDIHLDSPTSNGLRALTQAVERDAFPRLEAIQGSCFIGVYEHAVERSRDVLAAQRQESFLAACSARGIDTSATYWTI